jgi:tetratricopeptide (TPR) repeat protein
MVGGAWRSANRQAVWYDTTALLATTVTDAPRSYRARWQYAKHLLGKGNVDEALRLYGEAVLLYDRDPMFLEEYGQRLRDHQGCEEALPMFERALAVTETRVIARSRLYYCLLSLDRYSEARETAMRGAVLGDSAFVPLVGRADSLITASATPDG